MRATAFPDVVDALVASWSAALTGVDVADGANPDATYQFGDAIVVGFGDASNPAAVSNRRPLEGATDQLVETLAINCALFSAPVDGSTKASRDRLSDLLGLVDAATRADRRLGGTVEDAYLAPTFEFFISDGPSGDAAYVQFAVIAETYL